MNELPSTSGSGHDCFGDRVCTNPMCPRHGLDGELERLTAVDKPSSFTLREVLVEHGVADVDQAVRQIAAIMTPAKPGKLGRPKNARDRARSFLAHEMKTRGEVPART